MKTYTRTICDILKSANFEITRHARGSHEIWRSPEGRTVVVDQHINDRNLAKRVLKQAGISPQLIP